MVNVGKYTIHGCYGFCYNIRNVDVSENSGTVNPPNHPLNNRVFHYFHHPFWGTTIFGNTHVVVSNIFGIFTPIPGEMIQFDDHIFQIS